MSMTPKTMIIEQSLSQVVGVVELLLTERVRLGAIPRQRWWRLDRRDY